MKLIQDILHNDELYELEVKVSMPLRLALIGLHNFYIANNSQPIEWRPRKLKLAVLPYEGLNFEAVLNCLLNNGFINRQETPDGDFIVL